MRNFSLVDQDDANNIDSTLNLDALDSLLSERAPSDSPAPTGRSKNGLSISEALESLGKSRTEVSTESREALLSDLYRWIVSKPLHLQPGLVDEDDITELIKLFRRTSMTSQKPEVLLLILVITAYAASDTDEVATQVVNDYLPYVQEKFFLVNETDADIRANLILSYTTLIVVIMDGSGCFGLEESIPKFLEIVEGLVAVVDKNQKEVPVICNTLHGIGCLITLLYKGRQSTQVLDELIEDVTPSIVNILTTCNNLDIQKSCGRLIALFYELFDYQDDHDAGPDELELSPYANIEELKSFIKDLTNQGSRKIGKKDRKDYSSMFRDVLTTLERNESKDERLANRDSTQTLSHINLSKSRSVAITSWYSYLRLIHLRWCFTSGLHLQLISNSDLSKVIRKPDHAGEEQKSSKYEFNEDEGPAFTDEEGGKMTGKKKTVTINKDRVEKERTKLEGLGL